MTVAGGTGAVPGAPAPAAATATPAVKILAGSWQPVPGRVEHLTLGIRVQCPQCRAPMPLNGPTRHPACSRCSSTVRLRNLARTLVLAKGGARLLGSPYQYQISQKPEAQCRSCGRDISLAPWLGYTGAVGVIPCSCGAPIPTYPAPAWLREELPGVQQVFGSSAEVAQAQTGVAEGFAAPPVRVPPLTCPGCGGTITLDASLERIAPCPYCQGQVLIPDDTWNRLHPPEIAGRWTLTYVGELKHAGGDVVESWQEASGKPRSGHRWRLDIDWPALATGLLTIGAVVVGGLFAVLLSAGITYLTPAGKATAQMVHALTTFLFVCIASPVLWYLVLDDLPRVISVPLFVIAFLALAGGLGYLPFLLGMLAW